MQNQESDQLPPEALVAVDIDASPDDVWNALTTDDGLAGWLGQESTIGSDVGDEISVNDIVTGQRKRGVLDEITPGHRLGYTWWPETSPGDATRVAISIESTPTGTRVTVVESQPVAATRTTADAPMAMAATWRMADWTWRAALLTIMCCSLTSAGVMRDPNGR